MPRRVEDIKPGDRRSIRDIPLRRAAGGAGDAPRAADPAKERDIPIRRVRIAPPSPVVSTKPPRPKKRKNGKRLWAAAGIVAVVIAAAYASSSFFARATFIITPVVKPISVDATMVATGTSTPGYMTYKMIDASASESATVPAVNGPPVSVKAAGEVTLYNAYSTAAQRLIAGTRIANDSGLIYRLTGSVVVPGYTVSKGVDVPGSAVVSIVADQPGQNYDVSGSDAVSDFKIVAWQGTPRYSGFYARLASDVTGGWTGVKKAVDPGVLSSTTGSLQASLTAELQAKLSSLVPDGYILYPGAETSSFSGPDIGGTATSTATVTESGALYGALFKISDLVDRLSGASTTASFEPYAYTAPGLESLSFTVTNPSTFSPSKAGSLIARVKGNMKLVGTVPVDELKAKLAGLSLDQTRRRPALLFAGHRRGAELRRALPGLDIQRALGHQPHIGGAKRPVTRACY